MKKILILFVLVFLAGCTTAALTPLQPRTEERFKPYPVNTTMERSLGEQLIGYDLAVTARVYPGFIATRSFSTGGTLGQTYPDVIKGTKWVAVSSTEEGNYLVKNAKEIMRPVIANPFGGAQVNAKFQVCLIVSPKGSVHGTAACKFDLWARETSAITIIWDKQKYKAVMRPVEFEAQDQIRSRSAAIVYVGKSGDTIRLIYRETKVKDLELTYDLSESKTIAVKGISFEILSASNSSIKYKIKTKPSDLKKMIRASQRKRLKNNRM